MAHALLVVDFQNDFTPPDGALAVPGGDTIAEHVNALARAPHFALVVATRDWHPPDHSSFDTQGGRWPVHCVQGTDGAELHPSLHRDAVDVVLDKGQDRDTSGYSAFERDDLVRLLEQHDVDALTITGLATDVCVRASALDALSAGYRVEVVRDAVKGVDMRDSADALDEIAQAGGTIT